MHKNHHAHLQRIHLQTSLQARTSQLLCYYWKDWSMIYISFGGTTPTENKRLLFSESTRVRMDKRPRKLLCCTTRLCKEWSLDVSDAKNKYVSREVSCLYVSIYHSRVLTPHHNRGCVSTSQPLPQLTSHLCQLFIIQAREGGKGEDKGLDKGKNTDNAEIWVERHSEGIERKRESSSITAKPGKVQFPHHRWLEI